MSFQLRDHRQACQCIPVKVQVMPAQLVRASCLNDHCHSCCSGSQRVKCYPAHWWRNLNLTCFDSNICAHSFAAKILSPTHIRITWSTGKADAWAAQTNETSLWGHPAPQIAHTTQKRPMWAKAGAHRALGPYHTARPSIWTSWVCP